MSEIKELKQRINSSGTVGILKTIIRDDYEPAGDLMMFTLVNSGEYVQVKEGFDWKMFKKGFEPY